jgi:predicted RNase H-like HicB family nuclease
MRWPFGGDRYRKEKRMNYYVYISRKEGMYVAEVPALPGCRTMGRTEEEAVENIQDVIEGYLETLKRSRRSVPQVKVIRISNDRMADVQSQAVGVELSEEAS